MLFTISMGINIEYVCDRTWLSETYFAFLGFREKKSLSGSTFLSMLLLQLSCIIWNSQPQDNIYFWYMNNLKCLRTLNLLFYMFSSQRRLHVGKYRSFEQENCIFFVVARITSFKLNVLCTCWDPILQGYHRFYSLLNGNWKNSENARKTMNNLWEENDSISCLIVWVKVDIIFTIFWREKINQNFLILFALLPPIPNQDNLEIFFFSENLSFDSRSLLNLTEWNGKKVSGSDFQSLRFSVHQQEQLC